MISSSHCINKWLLIKSQITLSYFTGVERMHEYFNHTGNENVSKNGAIYILLQL